ncbi:MAG: hypothetical protein RRX92_05435 [Lachnospiraceae bacterium]
MKKSITYFMVTVTIIGMLCIWPGHVITRTVITKAAACDYYVSGPVQNSVIYEQEFIPQYPYLKNIALQISRDGTFQHGAEGSIIISLYDAQGELVTQKESRVSDIVNKRYQIFEIDTKVVPGDLCRYTIEGRGCESQGPSVRYGEQVRIGLKENQRILVSGEEIPGYSTVAEYEYRAPLNWVDILVYDAWIVTIAGLCYTVIAQFRGRFDRDHKEQ